MKITSAYINDFKCLKNFNIKLSDFNCLTGMNGSGKTTTLEIFEFFSDMIKGSDIDWFSKYDINNIYSPKNIDFSVSCINNSGEVYKWKGIFNVNERYCIKESLILYRENFEIQLFNVENDQYSILTALSKPSVFKYTGSILSRLRKEIIKKSSNMFEFKTFMTDIKFVKPESDENYIGDIKEYDSKEIIKSIQLFFPNIYDFYVDNHKIKIESKETKINAYNINQMSSSFCHIFNIFTQIYYNNSIILIDDIDNSLDQCVSLKLIEYLSKNVKSQILITTHNSSDDILKLEGASVQS